MPYPNTISGDKVIAFPPLGARARGRAVAGDDAERGRILLFTGVRYERMEDDAEDGAEHDVPPGRRDDEIWS